MAFRNFPTLTQAELEAALATLDQEALTGKTLASAGAGDVSSSFLVSEGHAVRRNKILWDLYVLAPLTYPREMLGQARSTVVFRDP